MGKIQRIGIYDKYGYMSNMISSLDFFKQRSDFKVEGIVQNEEKVNDFLKKNLPDIFIIIKDNLEVWTEEQVKRLTSEFFEIHVIVIGRIGTYQTVRAYFLSGVFDYLLQPFDSEALEKSLLRVYDAFGYNYVLKDLQLKIDALIDHIFLGGGNEEYIIRSLIDQIYTDWRNDQINCQIIADKAKYHIYEILIKRKPWLEKFLFYNDFACKFGFSLQNKQEIEKEWIKCFKKASRMVLKYQMIDDKLVYRIGKYVVVHVDERLTLDNVSEGVYLNASYVSHIFKKITGMSFIQYMVMVKMDRAKILLRDSRVRIYDVAATIGYNNPEYFAKNFKRETGYSPAEYQKMLVEKE